jgi:phage major head subunit gpT-like protein
MAILRTGFSDQFFSTALPLLEELIMEQYGNKPDMIPMIFNVESSDKWGEQDSTVTGFGIAPEKAENSPVKYDDVLQGYDTTYTHTTYALAFRTSREMVDDEKYGMIRKSATALGRSMFNTRQIQAAKDFNNAFTSATGPDGKELCATDHPLIGGGTASNELATPADLSVTSLRQALNDMEDTVDERGLLINVEPETLLVPNELIWDAEELLKSSLRPDTANNPVNAFQIKNLDYKMWNYLTDPDAWFLVANKMDHNMKFYEREPVNIGEGFSVAQALHNKPI